jgi:hypothetical protein
MIHYPEPLLKTMSLELGYAAQNRKLSANVNLVMAGKNFSTKPTIQIRPWIHTSASISCYLNDWSVEESLVTDDPLLESLKL